MFTLEFRRSLAYPPDFVFDIVTDFERYPTFAPGILSIERIGGTDEVQQLKVMLGYRGLRVTAEVEVSLDRPNQLIATGTGSAIESLVNTWTLRPTAEGCEVAFDLKTTFGIPIVGTFVARFETVIIDKLSTAFERRAAEVWAERMAKEVAEVP